MVNFRTVLADLDCTPIVSGFATLATPRRLSSDGRVYVTGERYGITSNMDVTTISYTG